MTSVVTNPTLWSRLFELVGPVGAAVVLFLFAAIVWWERMGKSMSAARTDQAKAFATVAQLIAAAMECHKEAAEINENTLKAGREFLATIGQERDRVAELSRELIAATGRTGDGHRRETHTTKP